MEEAEEALGDQEGLEEEEELLVVSYTRDTEDLEEEAAEAALARMAEMGDLEPEVVVEILQELLKRVEERVLQRLLEEEELDWGVLFLVEQDQ